jgi:hypothetical protein
MTFHAHECNIVFVQLLNETNQDFKSSLWIHKVEM